MGYEPYERKASPTELSERQLSFGKDVLPGWYRDLRGLPCIIVHNQLVVRSYCMPY